jgi:hypothetical protein
MDTQSPEKKNFIEAKISKKMLYVIAAFVLALLVFQTGMFVGYHRARFAQQFGDNYERTFGMHRGGFPDGKGNMLFGGELTNAHGSVGKIVSIALPTLVIADRDGVEKVILLTESTDIRHFRDALSADKLQVGDIVVVLGAPNEQAQIEAKLIRLLPPPPDMPVVGSGTPRR